MNGLHHWPMSYAIGKAQEIAPEVETRTANNSHIEARELIARTFGLTSDAAWLRELADKQVEQGELTEQDIYDRQVVTRNIFRALDSQWPSGKVSSILKGLL